MPSVSTIKRKKREKMRKKKNEGYYMFYKFTSVQGLHKYLKSLVHVNCQALNICFFIINTLTLIVTL